MFCQAPGRGVTRSKRRAVQWMRTAAEKGRADVCLRLASQMYANLPYAREVGHVVEAAEVAASGGLTDGHDIPLDVLTSVVHWLRKGGQNPVTLLDVLRSTALEGGAYCRNEGCQVVGHLKDFKVCPQCKTNRYCGAPCQKADWTTGGHKTTCGTADNRRAQDDMRHSCRQELVM
jgi:TPR repeat protein